MPAVAASKSSSSSPSGSVEPSPSPSPHAAPERKRQRTLFSTPTGTPERNRRSPAPPVESLPKAVVDDLGIFGSAVCVPSPAVWQLVLATVEEGNCNVDALRAALGGEALTSSSPVTDFWLEAWLAITSKRGTLTPGTAIRALHAGAWRDATVKTCFAGGMVIATLAAGAGPCRLGDWWYIVSAVATAPAQPRGSGAPPRRQPLSLTQPPPGVAAVAAAAHLVELARGGPDGRMHAAAEMVKRMAEAGASPYAPWRVTSGSCGPYFNHRAGGSSTPPAPPRLLRRAIE